MRLNRVTIISKFHVARNELCIAAYIYIYLKSRWQSQPIRKTNVTAMPLDELNGI